MTDQQGTTLKSDDDDGYCSRCSLDSPIQVSKADQHALVPSPNKTVGVDENDCSNKGTENVDGATSSSLLVFESSSSSLSASSSLLPSSSAGPSSFLEVMLTRSDWSQSSLSQPSECSSNYPTGMTSSEILGTENNRTVAFFNNITSCNDINGGSVVMKNSNNVSVVDVQSNKKMILSNEDGTADSFDVEPRKMIKLMPSSSSQNLLFYTRKSALGGLVVSSKPLINNNSISNNHNINNNVVSSNGSMPKIIKGNSNYNSTILIKNNNPRLMCGLSTSSATTSSSSLASAVITPRLHSFASNNLLKARLSLLSKNDTQCQISNGVVKTLNSGNNINYNIINNNNNLTSATNWSRTPLLVSAQKTCTSARTSQPYSKSLKVGLSGANSQSNGHLNSISSQSKSCWHVGRHELHPIIDHDYCEFSTFNAEIQSGIILMSSETLARTDRLNLRRNKTISVLNSSNQSSNQSNHLASLNCTHEQSKLHSIAAINASKNAPHHSINSSIINTNNTNNNNYGKLSNATYKNIDASQRNSMTPSTASNKTSYGSGGRRLHTSASSSSLSSKNAVGRPKSVSQKMDRSQLKLQHPITSSATVQQSSVGYDSSDDISSPPLTEDKNYVKIPGSYQNDFVYFATTRGRSSRKRSSERRSTNATSLASKAAGDTNNNSKITNNSSTLLGSTCYNKSCDDAVGRMTTSSTSSALSTLNTFAWYKEMATTDKSTRFGTPSSSSQQQQQQQQQFSTDTFNIDDMTNYLCSTSTEDYSGNNMTNKMLTSESDVVDLVMQMLPTSDLMLSPHVDLQQQPQQQPQHLFFNSSSSDVQQLQAQNLFFSTMSAPSISDSTTDLISDSIISTGNIQNTNAEDYHSALSACITGQQQVKKNGCDGADNTKTSGLRFTCDQTAKDHSLDFPNFTTSSQLLDEINDSDLLMTNDMPPCINDFFQVFHDSSSANDVSAIVDNHDDCNNGNNNYVVVNNLGVNIKSEDANVANISNYINDCSSIEDDGDINVTTVEDDHNSSSIDVVNSDRDIESADRSYDEKVDDQSQHEFKQHELVLTEPALNTVPTSRATSLRSYDTDNIDYNNNFDLDDSNIITHAQQQHRTQSNKNQQYPQQMLEWPKHLTSSCQLSPPLSSPSSSLSSPSSQVTPPELTSVNVYWNDLPGLLINGHEYIRLVDIHKQIMPAKDTGILKKRCAMLNLKFTSCSELQRDFLIRYMNAAKSKSKIIVSKEAALMLISFYVNPKVRSSGHSKSSNAVTSAHQSQSRSKYGDKSGERGSASGSPLHPSVNHNSSSSSTYFKFNQQDSASIKIICQPQTDKNKNASGVISANQALSKTRTLLEPANQNLDHSIKRSARLQNKRFSYLDMVNNCLSTTNKSATTTDQHSNNSRTIKSPCSIKLTSPDTSPRSNKKRQQQQHDQSNKVHHRIKRSTNNYVSDDGDATFLTLASPANDSKGSVCCQQQTKSKSLAATTSTPAKMYTIHTRRWSHDHDNDNKQNHNDIIKITNSFNFNSSHESKIFAHIDNNNNKNIHNIGVVQPADAKTSDGDDDEDNNKSDVVVDDVVEKDAWAEEEHGSPVDVTHERSGQQDLADVPLGSTALEEGGASDRVSSVVRNIDGEADVNNACTANSNIAGTVVDDDFNSINALVVARSALHTSNPSTSGDCDETKVPGYDYGGFLNHHQNGIADVGDDGGGDDDTIPEIDVNEDDDDDGADDSSEGIQVHVANLSTQHFNASSSNNTCNDDKPSSTTNPCRGNNTHSSNEPLLTPSYSLRKRRASQSICEAANNEATAATTACDHPSKLSKRSCDSNSSKAVGGKSGSRSSSTDNESNNLKVKVKKFVKLTKVRSAREIVRKRELRKVVGRPNRQANRRFAILKF
ncbi:hypothetical protein HELRODRAFT_195004 [Helobdella robusta]|uniref:Putative Dachshund-homology domain-containing protein n=1 Tax=Helobdella robusta TaxID=6412 RepID=T1FWN0_HELRO|nr:hypothetical protein HELRODRAFT_195004 [Helobdella robusta]ESO09768.1 hypothetical protein HELRODRAFT_195004 [Helobdella robusta]